MRRSRVRISVGPFSIYFFLLEDDIDVGGGAPSIKRFFLFFGAIESFPTSRPRVRARSPACLSFGRIPLRYGGYYYLARTYCYQFYAFNIDDSVKKP